MLNNELLRQFHLAPLAGVPEGEWLERAVIALEAGHAPEEIAHAAIRPQGVITWRGPESTMWAEWQERFERLCASDDERLRRIGEAGKAQISQEIERARARERHEAIYGDE
ncbi:MAG: hypothetical protein HY784_02590 [Chloroflexi bacterium]|nr:hypothetical protein [Chloroflexota bacterium]